MSYKEPAPISHDKDPLESMMKRFHVAAEYLNLDEDVYNVLKSSVKKIIVSLPISMDKAIRSHTCYVGIILSFDGSILCCLCLLQTLNLLAKRFRELVPNELAFLAASLALARARTPLGQHLFEVSIHLVLGNIVDAHDLADLALRRLAAGQLVPALRQQRVVLGLAAGGHVARRSGRR